MPSFLLPVGQYDKHSQNKYTYLELTKQLADLLLADEHIKPGSDLRHGEHQQNQHRPRDHGPPAHSNNLSRVS